ncbi:SusC/RagA family TonB-linked outer membrane protein [Flavivirga spongiicola]|uniref:TonB-dependent receptor n=1 Tax=Flavivirga spongiicola TaxID=421621 RepID=A0ABU7XLV1_9FLAO|nr:TonB-dependent receptor [Flavivirga sp. MEBiC05379]MDO5981388.1 TonB-dependent receptor [Flavivirga sp. MEBiC05379]
MKTFIFLFFTTVFALTPIEIVSQNSKIKVEEDKTLTVDEVFKLIMNQTDYKFFYEKGIFKDFPKVKLKKGVVKTNELLKRSLSQGNLDIILTVNNAILIKEKSKTLDATLANQQTHKVSGLINDKSGQPLPGANILEKGTTNGTQSDFDGKFSLDVIDGDAVLVISYLGFETQEVSVNNQASITVALNEDQATLDEVVVVGYGTQKKVNITGAVSSVSIKDIENRPAPNVSTLLAGQVPGLSVIQQSGRPGQSAGTFRIRGIGTLGDASKNNPLILVDGIVGDLQDIDVNDIENISVLKDASAAIYGVRAANGVVLITTKKGRTGVPVVKYHGGVGTQQAFKIPNRVNSYDYARLYNEARINDGGSPLFSDDDLAKFRDGTSPQTHVNIDHFKKLLKSGDPIKTFHNISVSGGSENTKYNLSFGFLDEGSLIKTYGYNRKNYRVNIDQKINDKLDVGIKLAGSFGKTFGNIQSVGQIITESYREFPGEVDQFDNGLWKNMQEFGVGQRNMLAYLELPLGTDVDRNNDYVSTVFAEFKIMPELKVRGQFSARNDNRLQNRKRNVVQWHRYDAATDTYNGSNIASGYLIRRNETVWDYTSNLLLTYNKSFNDHNLKGLLGFEQRDQNWSYSQAARFSLSSSNELTELNGVADGNDRGEGSASEYKLRSAFGRINYNFKDTYFFEGILRYDGTSRFTKENRFDYFPSFSGGWKISNEDFFKSETINHLFLRGSWGILGNQEIGNYQFLNTFGPRDNYNYSFGNGSVSGVLENKTLANANILWETTTSTNIGIDARLFNNALSITAEYFIKDTNDILLGLDQPYILGAEPPTVNAGSVENKGWELSVNYSGRVNDDFNYYINANVGYVKNQITDLKGTERPGRDIGDPIQNIFGYVADGLFNSQAEIDAAPTHNIAGTPEPGDIRYRDINGRDANGELTGLPDGVVDANDRKSLGTYFPKYNFGLNLGFDWNNFDFSMAWQGFAGHKVLTDGPTVRPFWGGNAVPTQSMVDNFWTPTNTNADFPRLGFANQDRNYQSSTYWVNKGDFAKLRNMQIGYTLPQNALSSLGINKFRIYVSGENLLYISKVKDIDPEFAHGSGFAWDNNNYPTNRQFLLGFNVTF